MPFHLLSFSSISFNAQVQRNHLLRSENCRVLVFKIQTIMVSAERIESSELHPPHAQLFFCVLEESTNVGTDVRYAKQIEL